MKMWMLATLLWWGAVASAPAAPRDPRQQSPQNWNNGRLTLWNGQELEGELNYNWKAEIVQLRRPDGTLKAYSAHQLAQFIYFDAHTSALRKFVTVNYPVKPTMSRPLFLEELTSGPLTVYRRLRHNREPIKVARPAIYGNDSILTKDMDNFAYYVLENDTFTDLDAFGRALWPRMQREHGDELRRFAQARQLDTTTTVARLMLISHYNFLKSQAQAASNDINSGQSVLGE